MKVQGLVRDQPPCATGTSPYLVMISLITAGLGGPASICMDIVISSPKQVEFEWRMFVVDSEVVGASSYRRNGEPDFDGSVPHHVVDFTFDTIALWTPAKVFCLDVGQVDGRLGVIEAN